MKVVTMWATSNTTGLKLYSPHAKLISEGKKNLIVMGKDYKNVVNKLYYLIEDCLCYGIIKLTSIDCINLKEFEQLLDKHRITIEERKKWWGGKEILFVYEFKIVDKFKNPKRVKTKCTDTFTEDIEFQSEEELIKDIESYDPKLIDTKILLDDWRIVSAWYSSLKEGANLKYSLEEVITLAKKIYAELKERNIEFYPTSMKPNARDLYKIVSGEELEEKLDLGSKDLFKYFDNKIIIDDFISIVGSVAESQDGHKPNDLDILIRMSNPGDYLKRAIQVRILKSLPQEIVSKVHFIWGDSEGPHDTYIPLYKLKLERIRPLKKVTMEQIESFFAPGKKFTPPKTTKETLTNIQELKDYFKSLANNQWAIEQKLDGFRCLIHKHGDVIKLYSDQGNDITEAFSSIVENIKEIKKDLIFDSELVPYNSKHEPMGRTELYKFIGSIKSGKKVDDKYIIAHVFDAIFYGSDLSNEPWNERHRVVQKIQDRDNLKGVPSIVVDNLIDLVKACKFVAAMPQSEGAMLKEFNSSYPQSETTSSWVKYKPLSPINVKIIKVNKAGDAWNYTVGIPAEGSNFQPNYIIDGLLKLGNTFNTKEKFDENDLIIIEVEEVWRHKDKENKIRYSIHKPHVIGPAKKVDSIDHLDRLVVSKGVEVINSEELVEPIDEPGTRGEAADKYWQENWQNVYPKDGEGKFVYQHHWRGLNEEESQLDEPELFKTNNSVHGDLRMETSDQSLFGFTVFLGKAKDNDNKDKFIKISEDKTPNNKVQGDWKLKIPHEWLDVGKGSPMIVKPGEAGATSETYAKFFADDFGEYTMGTWREHSLEVFFHGKKIKGRAIFQYVPFGDGRREWLITFPKDQTPYMDTHDIEKVKEELKKKGQKWIILAKPGVKPNKVSIE